MHTTSAADKAAQYLRMSTEHQQYSTTNQRAAIAQFAAQHQIEIVATYEDSGKSGLTLSGRPALRRLLSDVTAGQSVFSIILVYDVSRWGRFQDADESAHLEYLCRLSGVRLIYCAETFPNDGTPFASICKVVKRALAAEYSRELSDKVYRGKKRLIELGYRQGGTAGIGLRRCLIDTHGKPKALLASGERKSIATDRIVLIPGPPEEISIVRWIYRSYVSRDLGCIAIADELNRQGVPSESGRPWTRAVVKRVLTSAKYVGDNVWARTSYKLKIARQQNASEHWVMASNVFEGIISRALFDAAQQKRLSRCVHLSDHEIIERLRIIHRTHGRITARLIKQDGYVGVLCVRKRFGSIVTAAQNAGYLPTRNLTFLERNSQAQRVRTSVAKDIQDSFTRHGHRIERLSGACRFVVNAEVCLTVSTSQQRRCQSGVPRWLVKPPETDCDLKVAMLIDEQSKPSAAFVFPRGDIVKECLLYEKNAADLEALRVLDLQQFVDAFAREPVDGYEIAMPSLHGVIQQGRVSHGPRKPRNLRAGRMQCKTYLGAFRRASQRLREMIARAESISSRLAELRRSVAQLLEDPSFILLLRMQQVTDVPRALRPRGQHLVEAEERDFRKTLVESSLRCDVERSLPPRVAKILRKLREKWRREAMHLMLLTNDQSEALARSLVGGTPAHGLVEERRKRIYGAEQKLLSLLVRERDELLRTAIPAVSHLGRNSIDLVVVEGFVRRLLSMPEVAARLKAQNF